MGKVLTVIIYILGGLTVAFAQMQPVSIKFQAVVGTTPFSCSETYEIGSTHSKTTVSDFRFFVQDVVLVDNKGKDIPVKLTNEGKFQTEGVALLDFENGIGTCKNGTPELNTTIRGEVPKGKYTGLKFKIGVPEELNHLDPTKQPSPLNITRMMWSWQSGYKFIRIDTKTSGRPNGYVLHLGSAGCKTDANGQTTCENPNRPAFSFSKFDIAKDVVNVDLKALYASANVDINQEKTAAGCMSAPDDTDCRSVFLNLGLAFGDAKPSSQTFLRVDKMPKGSAGIGTKR
ncbi:MAG: metallo-mystery pair system four-Cys motif protein [Pyrinomonadaceae bacterium]|nr:metallo-mystery pair system four-Cys motif protein [Pyrinomonadaceae bacterium]MBP6213489.1 metallo-mystery pair system four-Cys motif protein [Pyrinomonadaceae bacterium]